MAAATGWSAPVCGRESHPPKSSALHGALLSQLTSFNSQFNYLPYNSDSIEGLSATCGEEPPTLLARGKAWLESSGSILRIERERACGCGQAGSQPQSKEETSPTSKPLNPGNRCIRPPVYLGFAATRGEPLQACLAHDWEFCVDNSHRRDPRRTRFPTRISSVASSRRVLRPLTS